MNATSSIDGRQWHVRTQLTAAFNMAMSDATDFLGSGAAREQLAIAQ